MAIEIGAKAVVPAYRRGSLRGLAGGGGVVALACLALGSCGQAPLDFTTGEIEGSLRPTEIVAASSNLLEEGKSAYERHCEACHGVDGDGAGEAAYLLYPKPRDFTSGSYRLVSTWEGLPTDEDLFTTISRGMPGSAMPSWGHLPERTRWGLVHYLKSLSRHPMDIPEPEGPATDLGSGKGVIQVPPEPAGSPEGRQRAAELFARGCAPCHGATGRGDGQQKQFDSQGRPTRPRDLTAGIYKGLPEPEEVYKRLIAGLPGSPMPSSSYLHGEDAWHLTRYVLSLSSPEQRQQAEMKRYRVVAQRVVELPNHPDAGIWMSAKAVSIHLMPLWWRDNRPAEVTVKAVHDGDELALLMVWPDATYDHTVIRPQDFRDAAAVQFALERDPPLFSMGQPNGRVNIWMWKAERQADLEPAYQDLDKIYPYMGIDSYPNFLNSPVEQPTRRALTLDSDPTYVTAWGAGNVVSDPTRQSSVEDLTAKGFGTLRARPVGDAAIQTTGVYGTGSYRVLFRRQLQSKASDSPSFGADEPVPIAFAVWDGRAGDRNGKKSVTIWQELVLEP